MTRNELIKELKKTGTANDEVIVFANGEGFPTLQIQALDYNLIEIGCGWEPREEI